MGTALKPDQPNTIEHIQEGQITSGSALAARIVWLMVGPMGLAFMGVVIVIQGGGWTSTNDAAFGVLLLFSVLARWWEQRSGQATTASGAPSTDSDCRSYIIAILIIGVVGWAGANLIGKFAVGFF